jgi:pimeloyl-[acyl-carrier protein] methyl ester esterase
MGELYWQTLGSGNRHLVLLHGWGLNAEVWHCIIDRLVPHFCLHLVDLPGYGRSQGFPVMNLQEMAETVLAAAPPQAIWLGWSLGGLVASQAALHAPDRVAGLITVASSPCFAAQAQWPGIRPDVLQGFEQQLNEDFQRTVERFLALQTLGSDSARQDARALKSVVLSQPLPSVEILNGGLEILHHVDLRQSLAHLSMPLLRIYGGLDGLVPRKIVPLLDTLWPLSRSEVIAKSAHAPFISHPDEFCHQLLEFSQQLPA